MRIAIAGATGNLGQQVVPRLLERGHEIRAMVRREGRLPKTLNYISFERPAGPPSSSCPESAEKF